jgi:hypothetical protein
MVRDRGSKGMDGCPLTVWDAIDRCRGEEEDMHMLREVRRRADEVEFRSYYEDDTF